jgi:hypothetical protein
MKVGWMIAIQMRVEDWIVELSHLMMHRVVAFIAIIAIGVISFKAVEHLFSRFELLRLLRFCFLIILINFVIYFILNSIIFYI